MKVGYGRTIATHKDVNEMYKNNLCKQKAYRNDWIVCKRLNLLFKNVTCSFTISGASVFWMWWPGVTNVILLSLSSLLRLRLTSSVVLKPGSGEPQGVLAFAVTQQLIDQWKQLITRWTHLVLGSESLANFRVKTNASTLRSSPGPGLRTTGLAFDIIYWGVEDILVLELLFLWQANELVTGYQLVLYLIVIDIRPTIAISNY